MNGLTLSFRKSHLILIGLLVGGLTAGCSQATQVASTATTVPARAATATPLVVEIPSPVPTDTPGSTDTPLPTATSAPSATPTEPATATTPADEPTGEAPAPTDEPTGGDDDPVDESFAPANTQVWQLDNLPYNTASASACGGDYPFNFYGLVGIVPGGDRLTWKRQDATANLSPVGLNNYFGQIPGFQPDYDLQIAVTFTGPTTLIVSYKLVGQSIPDCTHTYDYRAAYAWDG